VTQINSNINIQNFAGQQQKQQQTVRIPNYYYVPDTYSPQSVKEVVKENPFYDMFLKPFVEHPVAVLATWLGLGVGLDAYSTACSGKYEDSLVKKAANFGDNIQNSKIIQNKPVQAVISGLDSVGNAGKKAVQNSAILRAMKDTPTMPEWSTVKTQMFNQKQEVVQDFIRITEALKLDSAEAPSLKNIGLNDREITMLKKTFNVQKISQIPKTEAVNQVLLDRLGKTPEEIKKIQGMGAASTKAVKTEILKEMGLDAEKLKLIKDDVYGKYINDVKTAAGKVKGKVKMGAGHYSWMGPLTKPFERTVGCDEIFNKLHSMSDGAKTGTGRFMSKAMQMIHRGLTFGGGKLGALIFIAPLLVELGINVKKADKDQKIGTAANGFVENISWVFTFPLALRMMHSIGGIKNAGMGKEKVEQYRKLVEDFNKRVEPTILKDGIKVPNPNTFKTKHEYDVARSVVEKQLKELRTVKGQNIFTRGLRKLAGCITPDLCRLNSYRNSNFAANTARKVPAFFRNAAGIPIRFGIWGLISMGVLSAALTKCTTAIFGKSYDAMKQDERKADKKKQEKFLKEDLNQRLYDTQKAKQFGRQPAVQAQPPVQNIMTTKGTSPYSSQIPTPDTDVDNYTYIPSQQNIIPHSIKNSKVDTYTYIPSQECTIKSDKVNEAQRKYIPSQAAANIQKTYDNSGLQSALDRAQKAEDKALRVLAGNFEGM
jgi:hypothetical protein